MVNKFDKAIEIREKEEEMEQKSPKIKEKPGKEEKTDEYLMDLDRLIHKKEKKARSRSFYLEESVSKKLKQEARKRKVSESKIVNDLLKAILKVE